MEAVVGTVICVVIEQVKGYALSLITDSFVGQRDLENEIKKISDTLESIQDVLEDSDLEEKQVKSDKVSKWLGKLKDVAYDIEDALDDCMAGGLARHGGSSRGVIKRLARPLLAFLPRREMIQRLKSINEKLLKISKTREDLIVSRQLLGGGMSQQQHETTVRGETSHVQNREQPMVGREEIKAKIKGEILSEPTTKPASSSSSTSSSHGGGRGASEESRISIIAIVGMGGIGKTTLAQDIFNDHGISDEEIFPVRKWLYVGENFDGKRLIKGIIGDGRNTEHSFDGKRLIKGIICDGSNSERSLGDLQSKLIDEIKDKRFFIVLDDVWSKNSEEWDTLWKPLSHGSKGGIVVVTTRSTWVAETKRSASVHSLEGMSYEECMEIFKRCAFEGVDMKKYPHLEELCEQIVQKLNGVPLAAKIMGGYLGRYLGDAQKWRSVINDAEWPLRYGKDLVDGVVGLSYYRLPPHLKRCFAYCSAFPKGYVFDKETTVQMWIAQGYIQAHGNQLEEHTGSEYFEDLHHRSFFQLNSSRYDDTYGMHDLVHDFGRNVFSEGCQVTIGRDSVASSKSMQVRHLSIISGDQLEPAKTMELHKFKKLRTFYLDCWKLIDFPLDLFEEFRYIRVLELSGWGTEEFPDSIRHLRFLRYLDIAASWIASLPKLVCDLLNLQVLRVGDDCALPEGMCKLVNLRHLEAGREEITGIKGIGKLTCLQRLEFFRVGQESDWGIQELKDLNHLHKELTICGLKKVRSKEEAELACLKDKVYLEGLVLEWREKNCYWSRDRELWGDFDHSMREELMRVDSQVLEGLHPPPHLKSLMVLNNHEVRLPNWMRKMVPSTLVKVKLHGCRNWEYLPPLGRLPSLKQLDIWEAHNVKKIDPEFYGVDDSSGGRGNKEFFPRLESLCFQRMGRWEEWGMPVEENNDWRVFPSLKKVTIDGCPALASLSPILHHMIALEGLYISKCDELAFLEEGDGYGWAFPSLNKVTIVGCPKLTSLSPILRHMTALEELHIWKCNGLVALEEGDEHGWVFPSLHSINIKSCPKLATLSPILRHVTALRELIISRCDGLAMLGEGNGDGWVFPSLHSINIGWCPKLATLSPILRHMTALTELTISNCDELAMLGKKNGDGWEFPSLSEVDINGCPKLKSLSPLLPYFTSLKSLAIAGCSTLSVSAMTSTTWSLEQLETDHGGLLTWILANKFPSSEKLEITGCDQLRFLTEAEQERLKHLPSLRKLRLHDLHSLPSNLHTLGVLQELSLDFCRAVQCFPEGASPPRCRN